MTLYFSYTAADVVYITLGVSGIAFICRVAGEREMNQSASTQPTVKPLGLTLVAVYTGISAVLSALGGAGLLFAATSPGVTHQWWAPILGFALLLVGVLAFAVTYGLWVLVSWGHSLARLIYIVSVPLGLFALLADRTAGNVILQLVGVALAIWILVYLAKPEIKGLFRAS